MAVLGIGGLFFRARDPESLGNWYREHLAVGPGCAAPDMGEPDAMCWTAQGGPVVFAPFQQDTDYFPSDKAFMLKTCEQERLRGGERNATWGCNATTTTCAYRNACFSAACKK